MKIHFLPNYLLLEDNRSQPTTYKINKEDIVWVDSRNIKVSKANFTDRYEHDGNYDKIKAWLLTDTSNAKMVL